jgi:two-component system cell cycle sensor histidine kinase/response regulator CckA
MLQRLIGENIRLQTFYAEGPLRVRADPAQLEQVLMNLAVNSRDAMPEGGLLEIATETEPARAGQPGALFHAVRVTDTGTGGMSPEVLNRLFEPFFTTKEPGRGTGLGLSTAYGIVQQSGGHITCRSTPGNGTTFVIRLPATEEVSGEAIRAPGIEVSAGREKILVVEDEDQVRELVRRILSSAGYSVLTASTGEEGRDLMSAQDDVQMVITDLVLPGTVSGIDIARRTLADARGIRLLCISGYSEQLVSGASALLSSAPFLQKPFSGSELLKKIRALLDVPAAQ